MKKEIFLLLFFSSIFCTVRETVKNSAGMMHHKLVKDYSQRMTKLMMKQRQQYTCDRYLKDDEIDYTKQINVHHRNPVYGIIQLDNGNKFTILNHTPHVKKSEEQAQKELRFKPYLQNRFAQREPSNLQMQCILYVRIGKRHYMPGTLGILIKMNFYSNCKDQQAVKFFQLKMGFPNQLQIEIKNKAFTFRYDYLGQLRHGTVFNYPTIYYNSVKVYQSYRPKILKGSFKWRWTRDQDRKLQTKKVLKDKIKNKIKKKNNITDIFTEDQKNQIQKLEKEFQQANDNFMARKLKKKRKSSKKKKTKTKKRKTQKSQNYQRINSTRPRSYYKPPIKKHEGNIKKQFEQNVNLNYESQIEDVNRNFDMIIPNQKKQYFDYGIIESIWNQQAVIQCQTSYRKLQQTNKRKLFFNSIKNRFKNMQNSMNMSGYASQFMNGINKFVSRIGGKVSCNI